MGGGVWSKLIVILHGNKRRSDTFDFPHFSSLVEHVLAFHFPAWTNSISFWRQRPIEAGHTLVSFIAIED